MDPNIIAYLGIGLVAGALSGLLGIGGGIVVVPALVMLLKPELPPELLMKVALATSLATIIFTSAFAAWQQHRIGNSDFYKVKRLALWVAIGATFGAMTAAAVSAGLLKSVFCIFALYVSFQMFTGLQPRFNLTFSRISAACAGLMTGAMSSWVGIGGGNILVPFLVSTGETMKRAAGITSPVGVVVAVFSSLGFAISAYQYLPPVEGLVGYVHIRACLSIVATSYLGVAIGIRIAGILPAPIVKKIFAVLLLLAGGKIAFELLRPLV